jgi:hypothetical protein
MIVECYCDKNEPSAEYLRVVIAQILRQSFMWIQMISEEFL